MREAAIFGQHGSQVNVTDGRYVYMRSAAQEDNNPLFNYTLMPTNMRTAFPVSQLGSTMELAEPMSFTKGCRTLKIPNGGRRGPGAGNWGKRWPTLLFDLQKDPHQQHPLQDPAVEKQMIDHMVREMRVADAPPEQYQRLGLGSTS